MTKEIKFIRNTTAIRGKSANGIICDEFAEVSPIIVNSVVEVKATAALSKQVAKELANDTEEIDMKELLDVEANKGND
jgi:hypothetical protein